ARGLPVFAVTFNHLSQAFYCAYDEAPENAFVEAALRAGIRVRMISEDCPDFALIWLANYHNKFHEGSACTFVQTLKGALDMEK
ncbi:unnamed protein product, partial [Prorocentrum cordatum]